MSYTLRRVISLTLPSPLKPRGSSLQTCPWTSPRPNLDRTVIWIYVETFTSDSKRRVSNRRVELLGPGSQMINHKKRKVVYVGSATQPLDFTTMADTAAYTAAVATDPSSTPIFLRTAGDVVGVKDIADAKSQLEGHTIPAYMDG